MCGVCVGGWGGGGGPCGGECVVGWVGVCEFGLLVVVVVVCW